MRGRHSYPRSTRPTRRSIGAFAVLILIVAILPVVGATTALATAPVHVGITFEGCKGDTTGYLSGQFVCADADYTTGNLGKGWHELDLVPHRLTTSLGTQSAATTIYDLQLTADYISGAATGYDVISVPTINDESHESCEIDVGSQQTRPGDGEIYRDIEITQDKGTTCVFDYYERLAVGSHLYPGASLHSHTRNENGGTQGVGNRDISIPVKEIEPQSISKDMTASQGATTAWSIEKTLSDASLSFGDTCLENAAFDDEVEITVTWDKISVTPSGDIDVLTSVSATNPAHRDITINVTDEIFAGATPGTIGTGIAGPSSGDVVVPAGSVDYLVIDSEPTTIPDTGAFASVTTISDRATATYVDTDTNITIPQTTTATDSATIQSGSNENETVDILDIESISGTGFSYSVDSMKDAAGDAITAGSEPGTFTVPDDGDTTDLDTDPDPYVLGTETTDDVTWELEDQTDDGAVTFVKTVYLDEARTTTGLLDDDAYVMADDDRVLANAIDQDSASVSLSSNPVVTLDIDKSISTVLDEDVTFTFDVTGPDSFDEDVTVTILAGDTSESVDVGDELSVDLEPGSYVVTEQDPGDPWAFDEEDPPSQTIDLSLPGDCEGTASFTNSFGPPTAEAHKITDPAGEEGGWEMCLFEIPDQGDAIELECDDTDSNGDYFFATSLEDGKSYEIREDETSKTPFDLTDVDGGDNATVDGSVCEFTVDLPEDADKVFSCTFTNTERGTVTVNKTTSGQAPAADEFTFQLREGASATEDGTILDTDTNDATGEVDFDGANPLEPGTYQVCETGMLPGWHSTLSDETGAFVPNSDVPEPDNSVICVEFTLAAGEDKVFNVDNTPPPGGDARTIGYWKNWSSCTGGNQDHVLDQTLASFAGGFVLIGDLEVNTCEEAVSILSKKNVTTGKKMSSDAAYNMAAQLLAAKLNIQALAGTCAAANTAIADGQALLALIDFDGTGSYLGPKVKGAAATQRATANSLSATLDDYNNNDLC